MSVPQTFGTPNSIVSIRQSPIIIIVIIMMIIILEYVLSLLYEYILEKVRECIYLQNRGLKRNAFEHVKVPPSIYKTTDFIFCTEKPFQNINFYFHLPHPPSLPFSFLLPYCAFVCVYHQHCFHIVKNMWLKKHSVQNNKNISRWRPFSTLKHTDSLHNWQSFQQWCITLYSFFINILLYMVLARLLPTHILIIVIRIIICLWKEKS